MPSNENYEKLQNVLNDIGKWDIIVGWVGDFGKEIHPSGKATVASIAAFQENGTEYIPARPSLKLLFSTKKTQINMIWKEAFQDVFQLKEPQKIFERAAKKMSKLHLDIFDSIQNPPLKEETIKEKGKSKPLVDSGKLRENISWAVLKAGQVVSSGKVG